MAKLILIIVFALVGCTKKDKPGLKAPHGKRPHMTIPKKGTAGGHGGVAGPVKGYNIVSYFPRGIEICGLYLKEKAKPKTLGFPKDSVILVNVQSRMFKQKIICRFEFDYEEKKKIKIALLNRKGTFEWLHETKEFSVTSCGSEFEVLDMFPIQYFVGDFRREGLGVVKGKGTQGCCKIPDRMKSSMTIYAISDQIKKAYTTKLADYCQPQKNCDGKCKPSDKKPKAYGFEKLVSWPQCHIGCDFMSVRHTDFESGKSFEGEITWDKRNNFKYKKVAKKRETRQRRLEREKQKKSKAKKPKAKGA